jgi:uncharacterized membrane protein
MLADPKSMRTPAAHADDWLSLSVNNIGDYERWLSAAAGLGLLGWGLRDRSWLGLLSTGTGAALLYRAATGHCPVYEALSLDTAEHRDAVAVPARQGVKVEESIVIDRPAADLYRFWRQLDRLPEVFRHLKRVSVGGPRQSHWVVSGPSGSDIEWDAELFNERTNELIAWRSRPGGGLETAGSVRFQPLDGDRKTKVTVSLKYNPPLGKAGAAVAAWLGSDPTRMVKDDLQTLKRRVESGELLIEAQPFSGAHR